MRFAGGGAGSRGIATRLNDDDYFALPNGIAHVPPTFLGNHDIGRAALKVREGGAGAGGPLLERTLVGHDLLYLLRGAPVVYYGDEFGIIGRGGDREARHDLFPDAGRRVALAGADREPADRHRLVLRRRRASASRSGCATSARSVRPIRCSPRARPSSGARNGTSSSSAGSTLPAGASTSPRSTPVAASARVAVTTATPSAEWTRLLGNAPAVSTNARGAFTLTLAPFSSLLLRAERQLAGGRPRAPEADRRPRLAQRARARRRDRRRAPSERGVRRPPGRALVADRGRRLAAVPRLPRPRRLPPPRARARGRDRAQPRRSHRGLGGATVRPSPLTRLALPEPYDFALSTARYRAFGPDLANLWHEGGVHRVVCGREVRIEAAPGGVDVEPLDDATEPVVRTLLGLPFELEPFYAFAEEDPILADVVRPLRGLRPPLNPEPYETLVTSITAQQVSLRSAFAVRNRLIERFGEQWSTRGPSLRGAPRLRARGGPDRARLLAAQGGVRARDRARRRRLGRAAERCRTTR